MNYFWTNTIWYILLGILTVIELVFVLVKAKRPYLAFAFYLTVAGITLSFETIILIFLKSYAYYPKILKNPPMPFDDILAGNLFSQFSVAATVLLVTVLNLNYYWFFIFAGMYGIIEETFLALGIYSHNWYRTWMTVTMLPLAFWSGKYMYSKLNNGIKPIFYYVYILFALFPLYIIAFNWILMLLRLRTFNYFVLPDPVMSPYFLALIHFFLLAIPIMFIHFYKVKLQLHWKVIVILMLYAIDYVGYKSGLIVIKDGWFLPISTLSIFWIYASVFIADKLYGYDSRGHT